MTRAMAKQPLDPILIDKRVVERNIKKGLLSREDFDKALGALPDVAEQSEKMQTRLGEETPAPTAVRPAAVAHADEDDDEDDEDEEQGDGDEG